MFPATETVAEYSKVSQKFVHLRLYQGVGCYLSLILFYTFIYIYTFKIVITYTISLTATSEKMYTLNKLNNTKYTFVYFNRNLY